MFFVSTERHHAAAVVAAADVAAAADVVADVDVDAAAHLKNGCPLTQAKLVSFPGFNQTLDLAVALSPSCPL